MTQTVKVKTKTLVQETRFSVTVTKNKGSKWWHAIDVWCLSCAVFELFIWKKLIPATPMGLQARKDEGDGKVSNYFLKSAEKNQKFWYNSNTDQLLWDTQSHKYSVFPVCFEGWIALPLVLFYKIILFCIMFHFNFLIYNFCYIANLNMISNYFPWQPAVFKLPHELDKLVKFTKHPVSMENNSILYVLYLYFRRRLRWVVNESEKPSWKQSLLI